MANTAALLSQLQACKAEINLLTLQQMSWTAKYESNAAKLARWQQKEESWYEAYDDCMDGEGTDGTDPTVLHGVEYAPDCETAATNYANVKVCEYCIIDEQLNELAEMDCEYESMQSMIEALLAEKQAYKQSLESAVQNAAQDTGLIGK